MPGMGAAVVNSSGLLSCGVSGVRKRGNTVPVTIDDQWHLGSCTKAMTAILVARCVDAEMLSWDSTLCNVLPEVPLTWSTVTLEHLLSHQAGAPPDINWRKAGSRQAAVRTIAASPPLHPAGSAFEYSNCGYVLAGAMVERVYGRSWEELVVDEVWRPLGMVRGGFGGMGKICQVDQPWGHLANGSVAGNGPAADNAHVLGPAGRAHMPLGDWARFVTDQLVGLRGQEALVSSTGYCPLQTIPDGSYVRGWRVLSRTWAGTTGASKVLTHNGSNTMHYACVWIAPNIDLALFVCCNQGGATEACNSAMTELLKMCKKL